jgi:hypothetical protein
MGKMMGAFEDNNDMLDRPDLNKCPDCGCFFAQDNCPICGKPCPEEMRAGNRAAPKKQKYKYDNGYRTVMFVDWYHRWWFIALMAFVSPIISIILLITSPHKKKHKIIAVIIAVLYGILSSVAFPFILGILNKPKEPVNTSLSKEEYMAACITVDPEEFYRSPAAYEEKFVSMTLEINRSFTEADAYYYDTYYICICKDEKGNEFEIIIRDCLQANERNFLSGDIITVYGEGAGKISVYDLGYNQYSAPCVNMAYAERVK